LKWAAIVCSLPSWIFILGVIVYRFWLDGIFWPYFEWLLIPGCICVVCSLISMTLFLILSDSFLDVHFEICSFVWATFPLIVAIFFGFLFWVSITFGRSSIYDYFGRY
jgi:hypothetical protein